MIDELLAHLPQRGDATFWMSVVSFITSSALAIAKGVEFFGERRVSIKVETRFVGLPEYGNEIILLNASAIPITVTYYELVWTVPRRLLGLKMPLTHKKLNDDTPLDPAFGCNIPIEPHATHVLSFHDEHHFDWGYGLSETVYLKLYLVGQRKPWWFYITGPRRLRAPRVN